MRNNRESIDDERTNFPTLSPQEEEQQEEEVKFRQFTAVVDLSADAAGKNTVDDA